jgi:hypothetical protein
LSGWERARPSFQVETKRTFFPLGKMIRHPMKSSTAKNCFLELLLLRFMGSKNYEESF